MRTRHITNALLAAPVALLLASLPIAAGAQTAKPEPAPSSQPGNLNAAPPEKVAPPMTRPDARENSGGGGVITPPAGVDPGMAAAPPNPAADSRMPIVPPPGTRGNPGPTAK